MGVNRRSLLAILLAEDSENDDLVAIGLVGDLEVIFQRDDPAESASFHAHAGARVIDQPIDAAMDVGKTFAERFGRNLFVADNNRPQVGLRFLAKADCSHARNGLPEI